MPTVEIHFGTSLVAIFSWILEPDQATLATAAAEAILELGFKQTDKDRLAELSAKAKEGRISSEEQAEIDNYEKVGHLLSLMKSKARRSHSGRASRENPLKVHHY